MSDLIKNLNMNKDICSDNNTKINSAPNCAPVLIRQNATWDEESMRKEKKRVNKILASMGIPENYSHGGN